MKHRTNLAEMSTVSTTVPRAPETSPAVGELDEYSETFTVTVKGKGSKQFTSFKDADAYAEEQLAEFRVVTIQSDYGRGV